MTTTPPPDLQPPAIDPPAPGTPPAVALPPPPGPPSAAALAMFRALNRWFMVPACRTGLGAWLSMPVGGYILLLRVRGRRSGLVRETPLNYLVADGAAWVLAGFGPRTEWYRNLLADPAAEMVLPGRRVACVAGEVLDPGVRERIMPALVRSTALPSVLSGLRPWAPDEELLEALAWVPLVRLSPVGGPLVPGPDDPGGRAWIWRQGLLVGLSLAITWGIWRLRPRASR